MKLLFLAAVALSGGGCSSDAFVPKAAMGVLTSRSLVEPWAAARGAQPRGVSMKSQATPVKVEVSLGGLKPRPRDRASVPASPVLVAIPAVFLAERQARERHAWRGPDKPKLCSSTSPRAPRLSFPDAGLV